MKKNLGFSALEGLVIVFVSVVVGLGGWYVWNQNQQDDSVDTTQQNNIGSYEECVAAGYPVMESYPEQCAALGGEAFIREIPAEESQQNMNNLIEHIIEKEDLSFSYDPNSSTIDSQYIQGGETNNEPLRTTVTIGSAELSITSGISGIGGAPQCIIDSGDDCVVVDTLQSSFLGESITYRLIRQGPNFKIDTGINENILLDCCATISTESRTNGSILIDLRGGKIIQDANMLSNQDILKSIEVIESFTFNDE